MDIEAIFIDACGIIIDGNNSNGEKVSSGIYLYHYQAGDFTETKKMLLIK